MPSIMAANIGVWSHPLSQTAKGQLGWALDQEDSQSGLEQEEGGGPRDPTCMTLTDSSLHCLNSSTTITARATRRPAVRSDNQKLIEVRNRIFVGGLTEAINEDDLRGLFGRFGNVVEVAIKARGGDQFRGFGFVTFSRNAEAAEALRVGAGEFFTLKGRKINVCSAFKRVDKSQSAGLAPPTAVPLAPMTGWMGAGPMGGGLPVPMPNPYYYGPPVLANGMWWNPVAPAFGPPGLPYPMGGQPLPMMPPHLSIGQAEGPSSMLLGHEIIGQHCSGGNGNQQLGPDIRMDCFGAKHAMNGNNSSEPALTTLSWLMPN